MKIEVSTMALAMVLDFVTASHHPALAVVEEVLLSADRDDFQGNQYAFVAAADWQLDRIQKSGDVGSFLAFAGYGEGRRSLSLLNDFFSSENVRKAGHNKEQGVSFLIASSASKAEDMLKNPLNFGLTSASALPASMKLTPGLLDHGHPSDGPYEGGRNRLVSTFGENLALKNTIGLKVQISNMNPVTSEGTHRSIVDEWKEDWASGELDLHKHSFFSDPTLLDEEGKHRSHPQGAHRTREWSRAAKVVHGLSDERGLSVGEMCEWDKMWISEAGDHVLFSGLDHQLDKDLSWAPEGGDMGGRGGEGWEIDAQMACLMTLISYLSSVPQVVRVGPLHRKKILNDVASAVVQSANIVDKPLNRAGLDGTGEVIQIIDTGLDETSCFFSDTDGSTVEHGYFFDEWFAGGGSQLPYLVFTGGYFPADMTRRKVVQYIDLLRPDPPGQPGTVSRDSHFIGPGGRVYPWFPAGGFGEDKEDGHGTHVAGSAAGATVNNPADLATCPLPTDLVACSGKCISAADAETLTSKVYPDLDTSCPRFNCSGLGEDEPNCLGDDVGVSLAENGGVAPGAKLSIFDVSHDGDFIGSSFAENGLWESTDTVGAKIHSSSWGGDNGCLLDEVATSYDAYLHNNTEHLLLFSAGNEGTIARESCTVGSPAIAKNVLGIGSSSSGETRHTYTNAVGEERLGPDDPPASINTVSFFSSRGPTVDGRIKPVLVAPGDQVYSASSDGMTTHTCQISSFSGTSMATPITAGATALVRQYFVDGSFYLYDLESRGLCGTGSIFKCEAFSPSGPTVKAVMINSAHLMGGSSEPDGNRGFGRVHLEAGLPLGGEGSKALLVVDSSTASLSSNKEDLYDVEISAAGSELRATLTRYDPATMALAAIQLLNDLDLTVTSPSGVDYTMWASGLADSRNVVERVIVPAEDVVVGTWRVRVSSRELITDEQQYSLAVAGSIASGAATGGLEVATEGLEGDATSKATASFGWTAAALVGGVLLQSLGGI